MGRHLGPACNALAIACIAVALVKHETGAAVAFGALDRDAVVRPDITPWLVAAAVLVALGTVLMLRRRPGTG